MILSLSSEVVRIPTDVLLIPEFYQALHIASMNFIIISLYVKYNQKLKYTIQSIFLCAYIFLMILPSCFIFASYYNKASLYSFIAIQSFPFLYISGLITFHVLFPIKSITYSSETAIDLNNEVKKHNANHNAIFLFFSVAVIVFFIYFLLLEEVPLWKVINGSKNKIDPQQIRFSIYEANIYVQFLHCYFVRFVLPFCVSYSWWMYSKFNLTNFRSASIFFIIFGCCFSMLSLERSQILFFLATALMSIFLQTKTKRNILYQLMLFVGLTIIFFGFVAIKQYNSSVTNVAHALYFVMRSFVMRVIIDPAYMTYLLFDRFTLDSKLLWFSNIRLLSLFGIEYKGISSIGIVADAWVSFKYFGLFTYPLIISFLLASIDKMLGKRDNVITYACYIILIMDSVLILYSQLFSTMFIAGLLSAFFLIYYNNNKIKFKKIKNIFVVDGMENNNFNIAK